MNEKEMKVQLVDDILCLIKSRVSEVHDVLKVNINWSPNPQIVPSLHTKQVTLKEVKTV